MQTVLLVSNGTNTARGPNLRAVQVYVIKCKNSPLGPNGHEWECLRANGQHSCAYRVGEHSSSHGCMHSPCEHGLTNGYQSLGPNFTKEILEMIGINHPLGCYSSQNTKTKNKMDICLIRKKIPPARVSF